MKVIADPTVGETGVTVGVEIEEFALITDKAKVEEPELPVTTAVWV